MVLISVEEIRRIFSEALKLIKADEGPQIYHPKAYRGMESSTVMCVGIEDSWVVEAISRAVRNLLIVEGVANRPIVANRMRVWEELEGKGFLRHHTQASSPTLDLLSEDDWKALNRQSHFLKVML